MSETLTIIDNRTGKKFDIPIENESIRATDLRQIKVKEEEFGMLCYDPAFMNTASVKSRITYIDGDRGILEYRGYPIELLAEKSTSFLEVAYLLINGALPTPAQLDQWRSDIKRHTFVHENIKKLMAGFRHDANPMGMFISMIAALSTFYPDAKEIMDAPKRMKQIHRLIGKVTTIAAFAYTHSKGMPYVYPSDDLSYAGNFLTMMFKIGESKYRVNPVLEHALTVLFILHADHEQNCSTNTMRSIGSSHIDPYSAVAGAAAALWGPLHGGANEAVLRMLDEIGTVRNIPTVIKDVKEGRRKLMGFGHRVYKNYDPRAKVIKTLADEVFEVTGKNMKLEIALELERIALEDEYFVKRKLYPNVDFYSGLIYEAMGFPLDFFPVLFAIPRTAGWLAHWQEHILDPEQKIARPRQLYVGERGRSWVPLDKR
ncbi:MAG TPA: citrate (Si)-synthase [Bacteroidetes bacterium]|nr:MAG: citrate (Si)-synthase [Ignavibacteria bacterium GWA2_54_16]HCA82116.1 citrate (Si)-synthase [Bacteroidota bacterium]